MTFFISFNTFSGVVKLHVFRKKILGTLGDALTRFIFQNTKKTTTSRHGYK